MDSFYPYRNESFSYDTDGIQDQKRMNQRTGQSESDTFWSRKESEKNHPGDRRHYARETAEGRAYQRSEEKGEYPQKVDFCIEKCIK